MFHIEADGVTTVFDNGYELSWSPDDEAPIVTLSEEVEDGIWEGVASFPATDLRKLLEAIDAADY